MEFRSFIDLTKINDSMELESGQDIAELETDKHLVVVGVRGEVRVYFNDEVYKTQCQFPKTLMKLFHNGKAYHDDRVEIVDNNWFEVFLYKKNKDGEWDWTGLSDVCDCENNTPKEMKDFLVDCLKLYEEVGFKDDDYFVEN